MNKFEDSKWDISSPPKKSENIVQAQDSDNSQQQIEESNVTCDNEKHDLNNVVASDSGTSMDLIQSKDLDVHLTNGNNNILCLQSWVICISIDHEDPATSFQQDTGTADDENANSQLEPFDRLYQLGLERIRRSEERLKEKPCEISFMHFTFSLTLTKIKNLSIILFL